MTKRLDDPAQPRTLTEYLRLTFTGFAMGAADIVPGVSGGTMAFILGVYEQLINAIKSFNLDAIRLLLNLRIGELIGPRINCASCLPWASAWRRRYCCSPVSSAARWTTRAGKRCCSRFSSAWFWHPS